jgi:flagellar biosynthesis protein FliR
VWDKLVHYGDSVGENTLRMLWYYCRALVLFSIFPTIDHRRFSRQFILTTRTLP